MPLTKADAARQLGISRTTLYKLIDQGTVSATADGMIDQAELLRVAPALDVHRARSGRPVDRPLLDSVLSGSAHAERPVDTSTGQEEQASTARQLTSTLEAVVDILREQLQAAQEREALLLRMLHDSQQRYDRLLEAPRPAGVPVAVPPERPAYNPETHVLGALCKRGHDWQGTGQSLRTRRNHRCLQCDAEQARQRRRGGRA